MTQALRKKLPHFVFFLFLCQPLMDCLSYWIAEAGWSNTFTLFLRFGILGLTVLCGYYLSNRKWIYWTTAAISLLLGLGHVWAIYDYGVSNLFTDLTNFVRVLQLPWTTLCLITFLEENQDCYEAMTRGMAGSLGVILVITLLASLTGTEPHTYEDGSGYLGWFSNTNAQSSILCLAVPVAISWLFQNKGVFHPLFWLGLLGGFGAMYLLGTRLAFLGMIATGVGLSLSVLLTHPEQRKRAFSFLSVCLTFTALAPWSPMAQHQKIYTAVQSGRQAGINDALEAYHLPSLEEPGLTSEELAARETLWIEALTPIYTLYTPDFVSYFGVERTIRLHDFSTDIGVLTEQRPKKLRFAQLLMEDSPASARWFGLELDRFLVGENNYDVENDFHGIYYLYGAVGLVLMLGFLFYFLLRMARALLTSFQFYLRPDAVAWAIGLGCCLLHACFTAGVLRRPNASFYLAAALSTVYYLTKPQQKAMPASQ